MVEIVYARCLVCGYVSDDPTTLEMWNGYGDHAGTWSEACTDHSVWIMSDGSATIVDGEARHESAPVT